MDARKRTLHVELTDEQALLYMNSPTFKQGVDAFLSGVVPLYLDGLAARAEAMDAVTLARTQTLRSGKLIGHPDELR